MPTRTVGICGPIQAEHPDLHAGLVSTKVATASAARARGLLQWRYAAPGLASARARVSYGPAGPPGWIGCASRGLTNAEIADRLFLSPCTVASHLYRSYPKLGIAGRTSSMT